MKVVKTFFTFFMNYAGTHIIECRKRVALCEWAWYKSSILNQYYVVKVENHFQIKLVLNSYLNILYLPDQQITNMIIF